MDGWQNHPDLPDKSVSAATTEEKSAAWEDKGSFNKVSSCPTAVAVIYIWTVLTAFLAVPSFTPCRDSS